MASKEIPSVPTSSQQLPSSPTRSVPVRPRELAPRARDKKEGGTGRDLDRLAGTLLSQFSAHFVNSSQLCPNTWVQTRPAASHSVSRIIQS
jgi:hypothetical protein